MRVPVTEAKGQLTELVRRAEAGDEVILTRHGHPSVRLVPIGTAPRGKARGALLEKIRASAALRVAPAVNLLRQRGGCKNRATEHGKTITHEATLPGRLAQSNH